MTALAAAYAECNALARSHYENFPIGSWLLPRRLRDDLAAVYAYLSAIPSCSAEPE